MIGSSLGSSSNVIGGTGPGQRNVISGHRLDTSNNGEGVELSHDSVNSNVVAGDYIGTDA